MDTTALDSEIAMDCVDRGDVLVSHDRDFRATARRLHISQREYHCSLHRIQLRCREKGASARVREAMSLIEAEWQLTRADRPMVVEIMGSAIKTLR